MQYYTIGGLLGFSYFLYQTTRIEKIYYRPNENGQNKYNIYGIIPFLINPFKSKFLWINLSYLRDSRNGNLSDRLKKQWDILKLNWMIMTLIGSISGRFLIPYLFYLD